MGPLSSPFPPFPFLATACCGLLPLPLRGVHPRSVESRGAFAPSFSLRVMEFDGDLVEVISGAVARKHIVEVRPSTFPSGPKNSDKVTPSGTLWSEVSFFFSCDPVA